MWILLILLCDPCCRNADQRAKTVSVWMTWVWNGSMDTAWVEVSMVTCLPPVMRTSPQEPREVLRCREGSLCPSPIQHLRWTWPQRPPSPLSPSTPPLSLPPTYQRPTTSHAKRSTPKRLGRERSPPLHYLSNRFVHADSQVTSRFIRDCDLAGAEFMLLSSFFYLLLLIFCTIRHHIISLWFVNRYIHMTKVHKWNRTQRNLINCKINRKKTKPSVCIDTWERWAKWMWWAGMCFTVWGVKLDFFFFVLDMFQQIFLSLQYFDNAVRHDKNSFYKRILLWEVRKLWDMLSVSVKTQGCLWFSDLVVRCDQIFYCLKHFHTCLRLMWHLPMCLAFVFKATRWWLVHKELSLKGLRL